MPIPAWTPSFETVVSSHLPLLGEDPLSPDSSLADMGLDSLALVALLVDLESQFDVMFPDELLNQETFKTAGSLWEVVEGLTGQD